MIHGQAKETYRLLIREVADNERGMDLRDCFTLNLKRKASPSECIFAASLEQLGL